MIGYGTIVLPQSDGTATEPLDVLLVRDSTVITNTYTLGGAPAPAALLQAFGLMDVNVSTRVSYFFQAKGRGRSVARFVQRTVDGERSHQFEVRDVAPGTTTATRAPELLNLSLFPNPVKRGESIMLNGGTALNAGIVRLLDLQGRVVSQQIFNNSSGGGFELSVPASAKAGLHFYQLSNLNDQPVGRGKVMVQ